MGVGACEIKRGVPGALEIDLPSTCLSNNHIGRKFSDLRVAVTAWAETAKKITGTLREIHVR